VIYEVTAASPLGEIVVWSTDVGLCGLAFGEGVGRERTERRLPMARTLGDPHKSLRALKDYFRGDLKALRRLPIAIPGTPFQQAVWAHLRTIPAGVTETYGEVAQALRKPNASRAVGAANGANPLPLVVPCHRVVGTDGLVGYGPGLPHKRWLLAHEAPQGQLFRR
jgi:methylated-DNA-[protein]-cysteine S-methyltransferase